MKKLDIDLIILSGVFFFFSCKANSKYEELRKNDLNYLKFDNNLKPISWSL